MPDIMPTIPPQPTNASRPFWDACQEHRLVLQQCGGCEQYIFYPAYVCPHCGDDRLEWQQVSGRGRVHSFSIIHHPADPVFAESTPYVLALIELEEGPTMMSNIVGENRFDTAIGDAVEVVFENAGGFTLPRFRRVNS